MTDLPDLPRGSPMVPRDAPRPTRRWLAIRVMILLDHYYRPELSEEAETMMIADWIDALEEFPQEAVERAIRERIRSPERARPLPGEIRARARAFLEPRRNPQPADEDHPFGEVVAPEELERRREMARRVAEECPMLRRMTTSEADL